MEKIPLDRPGHQEPWSWPQEDNSPAAGPAICFFVQGGKGESPPQRYKSDISRPLCAFFCFSAQWMNQRHPLIKEPTNTESVCPETSALYVEKKVPWVSQKELDTLSLSNISKPPTDPDRNSETEEEKQFSPGPSSFSNLLHLCLSLYIRTYPSQQTGTRWGLCNFHNAPLPPCYLGIK